MVAIVWEAQTPGHIHVIVVFHTRRMKRLLAQRQATECAQIAIPALQHNITLKFVI